MLSERMLKQVADVIAAPVSVVGMWADEVAQLEAEVERLDEANDLLVESRREIMLEMQEEIERLQQAIDAVPEWVWLSQPGPEPYRWCPCCKGLHPNNGGKGHAEGCIRKEKEK